MTLKESLEIIKRYWNTAPVDVYEIARQLGVELCFVPMPGNISGQIRRISPDKFAIDVNRNQSRTRQRFTAAHELGHYIYHRDLLGKGVGDTLAFRAEGTSLPNPNITIMHERQANTFAANLLMPNHLITKLKASGISTPSAMARALDVSEEAIRIRLGLARTNYPRAEDVEDNGEVQETLWTPPEL